MKLLEVIDIIYPQIIGWIDFSEDDMRFDEFGTVSEDYSYRIKVLFDISLNPSIYINSLEIVDEECTPMNIDFKMLISLLEQKLNQYYESCHD